MYLMKIVNTKAVEDPSPNLWNCIIIKILWFSRPYGQEARSARDRPMVQAKCRERARSSYAEAMPIDAEWNGSPKASEAQQILQNLKQNQTDNLLICSNLNKCEILNKILSN